MLQMVADQYPEFEQGLVGWDGCLAHLQQGLPGGNGSHWLWLNLVGDGVKSSGSVQTLENVGVDRLLEVRQSQE